MPIEESKSHYANLPYFQQILLFSFFLFSVSNKFYILWCTIACLASANLQNGSRIIPTYIYLQAKLFSIKYELLAVNMKMPQVSWSFICQVQCDLCFASSMWNIICRYTGRRLLKKNVRKWKPFKGWKTQMLKIVYLCSNVKCHKHAPKDRQPCEMEFCNEFKMYSI